MALTVKHSKTSAIPDAGDTSLVQPSDWNADHTLTGTVPVANGGTGATTANDGLNALLPTQTGNNGKVLSTDGTNTSWTSVGGTGTVTSVSGTGTVSGISLSGTVTSSGSLTLGGTLDLSSPPAIGNTTASTGAFTTLNASTSLTTPAVQASNSGGLSLKNSAGTTQISMGGGGGDNVSVNVSTNLNGSNAQIDISPTGTGHVHIKPTGSGSVEINPTNVGTIDNMTIGATTPKAITGTTITGTSFVGSGASLTNVVNSATAGTGMSVSASTGAVTFTNTAPDQIVSLTAGSNVTITGTYPSFTIAASGGGSTSPAGANTEVQYNNSGAFGASSTFTYDGTTLKASNLETTGGVLADGSFGGTYVDGIVVDYDTVSAVGRISVGGADGLNFYNGGVAGSLLGSVATNGDWSLARFLDVGNGTLVGGATNPIIAAAGSANSYVQNYIHNDNSGTSASADFAAYPNNGTDASGWLDFGITSSTYSDVAYPLTGANEGYIFMSAPSGSGTTGNLVYATDSTGSQNYHQWYVGGFGAAKSAWEMQLTSSGLQLANALSVANGGTGATTAGGALTNLGAQATLVSGTNIKTVNSNSLLGSGDVAVQDTLVSGTNIKTINGSSVLGSGNLVVTGSFTGGTLTSQLILAAGTATAGTAPLEFQSGTVNTVAEAGAMEYDGNTPYFSIAASTRGVMPTEQIVVLTGTNTLTSQTAVQPIFDGGGGPTNGSVTLPIGTYQYECSFAATGLSATSGSFGFALGGAATKTYTYQALASKTGTSLTTPMATVSTFGTAAITTLVANSTGTVANLLVKGIIRVTVAGTVIPQISLTVASAAVIQAGSYFKVSPLGNVSTVATVGNWA